MSNETDFIAGGSPIRTNLVDETSTGGPIRTNLVDETSTGVKFQPAQEDLFRDQPIQVGNWAASHPRIAGLVINTPLMIDESKLEAILYGLNQGSLEARGLEGLAVPTSTSVNTTAIIPVHGTLVNRAMGMEALSGVTSYQSISAQLNAALDDDEIDSVLLDIDSPGGMVSGVFDLADEIYAARQIKPIAAHVNDLAASAAYLIASSAEQIYGGRTSTSGSIGVVMAHQDVSENMKMQGVKITHIFAGDQKVAGNPFEPLSEEVKADLQNSVDTIYEMFISTVARNRGMSAEAVIDTQARVFMGKEALERNLIDQIASVDVALSDLFVQDFSLTTLTSTHKDLNMAEENVEVTEEETLLEASAEEVTEEVVDEELQADAAVEERERILAILGDDVSDFQKELITKGLDAETAASLLAAAPKASSNSLDAAMSTEEKVELAEISAVEKVDVDGFDVKAFAAASLKTL